MNTLKYYTIENCTKMFNAIEESRWRIFKSIDIDGICRQNKRQVTTPEKLYKFIHQCKNPQKLYVSISTFLSPQSNHGNFKQQKIIVENRYLYPRAGYIYADCLLLDSYFYIDIDYEKDLRVAQKDARKVIDLLENNIKLKLHSIQFSGNKGFNLIYKFRKRNIKHPTKRIKYYHNQKTKLAEQIMKLKLKTIDKNHLNIMKDIFRVYALPYSIKPNGSVVTPLKEDIFMQKDIYDILRSKSFTRALKRRTKPIEAKADEKAVATAGNNIPATQQYKVKKRDGLISSPIHFKFMDNMVNCLKSNYITVLKLYKNRLNISKLKELQRLYKLSDFYIVKIGNYIYAYNTKALQFERIVKILRKAKSRNLSYFITHRHLPIQITPSVYENGETADEIEYIGTLKSKFGTYDNHSKPHSKLFGLDYENLVGKENNVGLMRVS